MDRNSEANHLPSRATPQQPSQEAMKVAVECLGGHSFTCHAQAGRTCNCIVNRHALAIDALVQRAAAAELARAYLHGFHDALDAVEAEMKTVRACQGVKPC